MAFIIRLNQLAVHGSVEQSAERIEDWLLTNSGSREVMDRPFYFLDSQICCAIVKFTKGQMNVTFDVSFC